MAKQLIALVALAAVATAACGGSSEEESLSPSEARRYFANIDSLLDQVVVAHEEGDREQAAELAGEAYLENYEHLEHDLEEEDEELNEEIERLLGPPFRRSIQDGMSQDEVEARVSEVKALLEQAKSTLEVE